MGKRFNPVELVIFMAVATGFGVSAYRLVQEPPATESTVLAPLASNPVSEGSREPASVSPLFGHVDFNCKPQQETQVQASKIRITGPICGADGPINPGQIAKAIVVNSANQFNATVFTDLSTGKFSTDYIPLNSDKNSIRVEFQFKNGKTLTHDLTVQKN